MALTQGASVPSTRFRWAQYAGHLEADGLRVGERPARFGAYAPPCKAQRPLWGAQALADSLWRVTRSRAADLRFLQRNLIATLCTWEPLLRRPFVFDVDDAIFAAKRGASAFRISRRASLTICGNQFLAEAFRPHGEVAVLPTAVDTDRFRPGPQVHGEHLIVGWSGTSSGFGYLRAVEPGLAMALRARPNARLCIVSNARPTLPLLPPEQVEFVPWTARTEVDELRRMSVGIMPLTDDVWSRGKCSFKMLTYMAVGTPVVVSPVGMNTDVLAHGRCGVAADSPQEWAEALVGLLDDDAARREMGATGRQVVEQHYATSVIGPRLGKLIKDLC